MQQLWSAAPAWRSILRRVRAFCEAGAGRAAGAASARYREATERVSKSSVEAQVSQKRAVRGGRPAATQERPNTWLMVGAGCLVVAVLAGAVVVCAAAAFIIWSSGAPTALVP
jgi:hypothetical protein